MLLFGTATMSHDIGALISNTATEKLTSAAVITSGLPVGLSDAGTNCMPSIAISSGTLMYCTNTGSTGFDKSYTNKSPVRSEPTNAYVIPFTTPVVMDSDSAPLLSLLVSKPPTDNPF